MKNLTATGKSTFRSVFCQSTGMLVLLAALPFTLRAAEPQKIAMTADRWESQRNVQFLHSDGSNGPAGDIVKVGRWLCAAQRLHLPRRHHRVDTQPNGSMGAGIAFRYRDKDTYEDFYLRPRPNCDQAEDCIQYAPNTKGVLLWDVYPEFQSPAPLKNGHGAGTTSAWLSPASA